MHCRQVLLRAVMSVWSDISLTVNVWCCSTLQNTCVTHDTVSPDVCMTRSYDSAYMFICNDAHQLQEEMHTAGITNNINDCFALFKCPRKPWQRDKKPRHREIFHSQCWSFGLSEDTALLCSKIQQVLQKTEVLMYNASVSFCVCVCLCESSFVCGMRWEDDIITTTGHWLKEDYYG